MWAGKFVRVREAQQEARRNETPARPFSTSQQHREEAARGGGEGSDPERPKPSQSAYH
jgi:hypothetical protein